MRSFQRQPPREQSVVCLWPKQDYIVFIVLLKFPVDMDYISFFSRNVPSGEERVETDVFSG